MYDDVKEILLVRNGVKKVLEEVKKNEISRGNF